MYSLKEILLSMKIRLISSSSILLLMRYPQRDNSSF